jgi:mRNA-degrading endonuclease toxin of MazEF toxin-antitoxin module
MATHIYLRGQVWRVKPSVARRTGVPKVRRRWLIVQNDDLGVYPTRIVCYLTSVRDEKGNFKFAQKLALDTHVMVLADERNKLGRDVFVVCGTIHTIRNDEFLEPVARISDEDMKRVDAALALAVALNKVP